MCAVKGTAGFHSVSFFLVKFKMCLGFAQIMVVACWVPTTSLIGPWVLCSSPTGDLWALLCSGGEFPCSVCDVQVRGHQEFSVLDI